MIRKLGVLLVLLTALSITVGAAAVLHISDTAPLQVMQVEVTVPIPEPTTTTTTTTTVPDEPPPGPKGPPAKIWVCVIQVDKDGNMRLKQGQNPLHVSENAEDALTAKSPHHPSYVVPSGDVECALPTA